MSRFRSVLDEVPVTRAAIFRLLKERGLLSIPQIAEALGVTHEAARKHVTDLQRSGWIDSDCGASVIVVDVTIGSTVLSERLQTAGGTCAP